MTIKINDKDLAAAAGEGMDQFLGTIIHAFKQQVGEEELNVQAMQQLSADQITLWGYMILRDELMDEIGRAHV